ncbi:alpha 1,2 mannosyltransferase [Orbilia oligospora]|uniref:Mannosyltransferase n=1 Tax=Orbilia oligospora TaxID=2813651 RepID=A0A7C8P9M4_ORBOL|nr:alpha 1,2 mannosyltransferase [Orbilia oligospora]KAF3138152.1 alpha 1,2 mannosyltransferase [Orbilia oligospora]KAF3155994.1 alpha 1,2 mannosyltransferase [Orbilia oligospora]
MAWKRRLYLSLALARLYFALTPSYIHPDEHFQGPEVVAGEHFGWKVTMTWEFTTEKPIRSYVPLLAVYAMPMTLLQWIANGDPSPTMLFYAVRLLFYFFSMVYEDWALLELGSATMPNGGLLLTASSWVTWSIQTRSFSNSVETVILLWSLVFLKRIVEAKAPSIRNCVVLGLFTVFGTFNRITFPAFLILPGLSLLKHFFTYPSSLFAFTLPALLLSAAFIILDTHIYTQLPINSIGLSDLIITPLNNIAYNSQTENLAQHGLHPFYTHLLVNLPQLLGPAIIPLLSLMLNLGGNDGNEDELRAGGGGGRGEVKKNSLWEYIPLQSAVSGILILSTIKHQEARFLIPTVPLLLSSISLPKEKVWRRRWMGAWAVFNIIFGTLMGVYHQGGVVPAQLWIAGQQNVEKVVWWKTYKPPTWLLGSNGKDIETVDLMGGPITGVLREIDVMGKQAGCDKRSLLVVPGSARGIEELVEQKRIAKVWGYRKHLNLDDMDFGDDGVVDTLQRVIGKRGIVVYEVVKPGCGLVVSEVSKGEEVDSKRGSGNDREL